MSEAEKVRPEPPSKFNLIINRKPYTWPNKSITGLQIKELASSSAEFVVNQIIDGPGEDPEIADAQSVPLTPPGTEKFVTRKPKTTPGA